MADAEMRIEMGTAQAEMEMNRGIETLAAAEAAAATAAATNSLSH